MYFINKGKKSLEENLRAAQKNLDKYESKLHLCTEEISKGNGFI
jgi:hypothetical protein